MTTLTNTSLSTRLVQSLVPQVERELFNAAPYPLDHSELSVRIDSMLPFTSYRVKGMVRDQIARKFHIEPTKR